NEAFNENGKTPLHIVCERQSYEEAHKNYPIIKTLISAGADPRLLTYEKNSPSDLATNQKIKDLLSCLENFVDLGKLRRPPQNLFDVHAVIKALKNSLGAGIFWNYPWKSNK